jgi:hydrogenase maturation protein HypF
LLYSIFGDDAFSFEDLHSIRAFSASERTVIRSMLIRGINSPVTSSAGRIFDAVASMIGLQQICAYEGQAAMELEFAADDRTSSHYPFFIDTTLSPAIINTSELVKSILRDLGNDVPSSTIAARLHNTMVEIIVAVAKIAGEDEIALSGGCFQNKVLTESAVTRLTAEGFKVYWHQHVPPNDGGISLGQVAALAAAARRSD